MKTNPNAGIERSFIDFDKHGDGKLTPDEWPHPVSFKLADTNHDGVVTLEEFLAFQLKLRSADFAATVRFQELDKKGDGKLTPEEFQPAGQFALADTLHHGVVTLDEFKAYFAGIAQHAAGADAGMTANFNKLDKKGDGKLTPDEWKQPARFKLADANGDGVVNKDEYLAFMKKLRSPEFYAQVQFQELDNHGDGKLTPAEWPLPVRFKMADANGDGVVTRDEFIAFAKKLRSPETRIAVQFQELDKKGDGKLTAAEVGNAELFAKMDAHKEGVVSFEAFKAYMLQGH